MFTSWASGALDPESRSSGNLVTSVKRGVWAMIAVFLAYCLLQALQLVFFFYRVLIRPHPAIWRLVHGMAVIYLVCLTFLLFQKRDDARQFMKFLHPDLGVELPERSYGADCRIYVPENPTSRFKNVYAIMIRNQPLLWVLSIGFELMELSFICQFQLTFRHMLPNFNECWWDSIILDILVCNWFGRSQELFSWLNFTGSCKYLHIAFKALCVASSPPKHVFGLECILLDILMENIRVGWYKPAAQYYWQNYYHLLVSQVKRTLGQFTPAQWDKDEWHPLLGPWRFIQVLSLCIVFLTVELNTFFLKFCLWIPPRNPVIVYRLILWWLIAIPTIREYNSYLQDRPISQTNASMVGNFLDVCWGGPFNISDCVVVATTSNSGEKETMNFPLWYIIL
ncbi:CDP-diacylglycerol--serine O-phosphatidyltransferase 1 [Vitis vinifera]|uniref:CDP-diacylglycerol--serine O-phosphatidyltransferase n=1 Tax=Vitis vinifera TaxID=29760 RepID=A0A438C116_VITVI|nr:CDP-diacylglycerol--serine O-phosphatidyltransferase 1 [Vitis vinifera]